jgi:tripartite-type tricarboxylate transporter receptor subunit TctC
MKIQLAVAFVTLAFASIGPATAASPAYPSSPVTIVVPFAPGAADTAARVVAQKLSEALGQRFLVENRPGASGAIGAEFVKRAAPDGYTLLFATASQMSINPQLKPMNYDPRRDFTNVSLIGVAPYVLAVNSSLPAKSVKELVTYAKATPGPLRMGNAGVGSLSDAAAQLFGRRTGVKVLPVPFKGTHPAAIALEGGECPAMIATYVTFPAGIQSGKVRVLAVASAKRLQSAPDIPTFAEAGFPGLEVSQWWGLFGPVGLPDAIVQKLNRALNDVLRGEDLKRRFTAIGVEPLGGTPADLTAYLNTEYTKWGEVLGAAKAQHTAK